jgi:hypothetical protein
LVIVRSIDRSQIVWPSRDNTEREKKLVEIGPRFVLVPVRIFNAGFGGSVLYENLDYQSPNEVRESMCKGVLFVGNE